MAGEIEYLRNQLDWLNQRLDNGLHRQAANQIGNQLDALERGY